MDFDLIVLFTEEPPLGEDFCTIVAKKDLIRLPLGVIPDDGDCAKAALFFGSDYANVVTGAALDVNGGEYMPI